MAQRWHTRPITVRLLHGAETIERQVDADVCGQWAVHRATDRGRDSGLLWSVSHVPSGCLVANAEDPEHARRIVAELGKAQVGSEHTDAKGVSRDLSRQRASAAIRRALQRPTPASSGSLAKMSLSELLEQIGSNRSSAASDASRGRAPHRDRGTVAAGARPTRS